MIKLMFRLMSFFWACSPVAFGIGWYLGVWNTHWDWAIFLGLSAVSTFVLFMNYDGPKK